MKLIKLFSLSLVCFLFFNFFVVFALAQCMPECPTGQTCSYGACVPDDDGTPVPDDSGTPAAPPSSPSSGAKIDNPLGGDFFTIIKNATTIFLGFTGVLALIAFIYGGITWMLSAGEASKVQKGKDMMKWAVFGLVVIFGAYAILDFVLKMFGL